MFAYFKIFELLIADQIITQTNKLRKEGIVLIRPTDVTLML